jgi:ZIP family zinc transporter
MDGELLAVLKWTAVYTGFTFLCTAAGAAAVFFLKPDAKTELAETLSLGFAAGIMTAASVWSLIIPAQEMAQKQGDTPWLIASLGIAAGAGFLKLLDAVLPHLHPGASKPEGPKTKMHRAMLLFLAITLHNIPEGGSVGLTAGLAAIAGDSASLSAAFALALGIGIQNIPEGAAVSLPLAGQGVSRWRAFWFGTGSGAVEPLFGILAALAIPLFLPVMPFMLAFAAGAMLYVVVEELIPAAHLSQHSDAGTLCFIFGFVHPRGGKRRHPGGRVQAQPETWQETRQGHLLRLHQLLLRIGRGKRTPPIRSPKSEQAEPYSPDGAVYRHGRHSACVLHQSREHGRDHHSQAFGGETQGEIRSVKSGRLH